MWGAFTTPSSPAHCYLGLSPAGLIRVVSPFDAVTQAQLKRIRPRGHWHGPASGWEFPLAAADALQTQLGKRFHIAPDLEQWLSWSRHPLPPMPSHRDLVAAADLQQVLPDGRQPLRHQRSGVRWLLARRGALLADEMGLGKTLTALLAARAMVRCMEVRVLVIAPVGLSSPLASGGGCRRSLHCVGQLGQAAWGSAACRHRAPGG